MSAQTQPASEIPNTSSKESPARKQAARPSSRDYQKVPRDMCRDQIEDRSMSSMYAEKMEDVMMSETLP